jgi:hypothetical protein
MPASSGSRESPLVKKMVLKRFLEPSLSPRAAPIQPIVWSLTRRSSRDIPGSIWPFDQHVDVVVGKHQTSGWSR